ncbi:MAG: D-alanyl-D-alanine carboxypeptidase/D-alanyl-D-alanine-endopeptidase [Planctomycetota bacterium]|nr:MAG: D-alanyl-D-alanine carboxypeptidase/D-alanyl-D-alanine-endopeptidase [Planctomycetota bacterium]
MFRLRRILVCLLACIALTCGHAPPRSVADESESGAKLKALLDAHLATRNLPGEVIGVLVADAGGGQPVYEQNGKRLFIPASNMKLVTTAAALEILGCAFKFKTSLYRQGPLENGIVKGDLLVAGSGDPNISGRFHDKDPAAIFKKWAAKLKAAGIKRVTGSIILDDTVFDRVFIHADWPKNQLQEWYEAPVGALALNDSCVDVTVKPGTQAGAPAVIIFSPPTKYLQLANRCTTTSNKKKHTFGYTRRHGSTTLTVRGKFWTGTKARTFNVTVPDPVKYFGTVLLETLASEGIRVSGGIRMADPGAPPSPEVEVATHTSTLEKTLPVMNKRSQNFYAECIFKAIGKKSKGKGTFENGAAAVGGVLEKWGISKSSFTLRDGSGLSKKNMITPQALLAVMRKVYGGKHKKMFLGSLAVGGVDGTLKKRFRKSPVKGNVRAKSGYLTGTSALSGFVTGKSGKTAAFVILINGLKTSNAQAKKWQQKLVEIVYEEF